VVNLATHVPRNSIAQLIRRSWREMDRIRTEGSALLVDAALANGVKRFIQESFAPIYPDSDDRWITEDVKPEPAQYNKSALDAEAATARFTRNGGVGVVLRFAFLYGPNDSFTRQLFYGVRHGWLPVPGKRDGYFPMLSHDDAALAVYAALSCPAGIYNVVDDEPMTRSKMGETIAEVLRVDEPRITPAWVGKITGSVGKTVARSQRISNAKLRAASSWSPKYPSVKEGLAAVRRSE
jgi:nucleoside-diphosphate-sugar epimerase